MIFKKAKHNFNIDDLYIKIVELSRKKYLYKELNISDSFDSRITLIFFHISFILINMKKMGDDYKKISQSIFDHMFGHIELNMRELGYGDTSVNKKMKILINSFYNTLLKLEKFHLLADDKKKDIINDSFYTEKNIKNDKSVLLVKYFDNFNHFAINLSLNKIVKGDINFSYSI